jgi:hypothetical protein
MTFNKTKTIMAGAAILLNAGCGGSSNGSSNGNVGGNDPIKEVAALHLSGTAATGLALVDSAVEVKCATGNAATTTNASGNYTLDMVGAALPCIIKVTGEVDGAPLTLHSVTADSTSSGASTSAIANVTPLTEMIVAQFSGQLPSEFFGAFSAGTPISPADLVTATTAVVAAIQTATGIDLGAINPFTTPLVPATATTAGNQYDDFLESLKQKVSIANLPLIVNQIASSAQTPGDGVAPGLTAIISAANNFLAGCPAAISGKYRTIDYWGRTTVRQIDFATGKFNRGDGQPLFDITPDPEQPCKFMASGTFDNEESQFDIVIGHSGAGAYRSQNLTTGKSSIGYIFPVQGHPTSALSGNWTFLQSGYLPGEPVQHLPFKLTINTDNQATVCDYVIPMTADAVCETESQAQVTLASNPNGGFNVIDASVLENDGVVANIYGYRAPNGSLTLFGTTNPSGANSNDIEQTSFVGAKLQPLALPAVGAVSKFWDLSFSRTRVDNVNVNTTAPISKGTKVVTEVDASTGTVSRVPEGETSGDTLVFNRPLDGMRLRAPTNTSAGVLQIPLPGLGMTATVNSAPSTSSLHFYFISVNRP